MRPDSSQEGSTRALGRVTRPTEIPSFNTRVPIRTRPHPLARQRRLRCQQALREPETYPRPPPETGEERKSKMQRAIREQEWTTTEFGFQAEGPTHVPQLKKGMVSPIQCQLCATHRIPALRFCYQCFPNVAVNYIITATNGGILTGTNARCASPR